MALNERAPILSPVSILDGAGGGEGLRALRRMTVTASLRMMMLLRQAYFIRYKKICQSATLGNPPCLPSSNSHLLQCCGATRNRCVGALNKRQPMLPSNCKSSSFCRFPVLRAPPAPPVFPTVPFCSITEAFIQLTLKGKCITAVLLKELLPLARTMMI